MAWEEPEDQPTTGGIPLPAQCVQFIEHVQDRLYSEHGIIVSPGDILAALLIDRVAIHQAELTVLGRSVTGGDAFAIQNGALLPANELYDFLLERYQSRIRQTLFGMAGIAEREIIANKN